MNDESGGASPAIQTLYRVYRPTTFDADELVGQEHIARTLKSAIRQNRLAHAYLFCGPRGTGKTSTARLLAKAANCLNPDPDNRPCNQCEACRAIITGRTMDIVEIDAASNRGIDEIRELRDKVQFTPALLRYRFYIIDECHQLTSPAWNAFLKTLEEPPPHAKFVLCTTEPEKLLDTVASRCQRFDFHRIPLDAMVGLMRRICAREGLVAGDDALATIARQATGSMRDALSLLDTLASYGTSGDGITLETVQRVLGAGSSERVLAIIDAMGAGDVGAGIAAINAAAEAGVEPGVLAGQIVDALRALLYAAYAVPGANDLTDASLKERVGLFPPAEVAYLTKLFSTTEFRLKHTAYGHLPLELAVVDAVLMRAGQAPIAVAAVASVQTTPPPVTLPVAPPAVAARPVRPIAVAPPPMPDDADVPPVVARPERLRPERALVPPPAPVAPPLESALPASTMTLEQIDGLWNRVKQGIKMETGSFRTAAILNDVSPFEIQGNMIILTAASKFHCDHMNKDETRLLLERVIGGVVGQPVRVRCEEHGSRQPPDTDGGGRPVRPLRDAPALPPAQQASPVAPFPPPSSLSAPAPLAPIPSLPAPRNGRAPTAPPDEDDAGVQRLANLFDAVQVEEDAAPPFPPRSDG